MIFGRTENKSRMHKIKMPIVDLDVIKSLLPHREPMIMISSILTYSNDKVTSTHKIQKDNILAEQSRLTEAGLIENMAQTAACLAGIEQYNLNNKAFQGYLVSVKNLTINSLPEIDKTIYTTAVRTYIIEGLSKFTIEVECDGRKIVNTELTTAIAESINE